MCVRSAAHRVGRCVCADVHAVRCVQGPRAHSQRRRQSRGQRLRHCAALHDGDRHDDSARPVHRGPDLRPPPVGTPTATNGRLRQPDCQEARGHLAGFPATSARVVTC